MDFFEFAQYLMNGGGSIMAASWLLERWGYFKIQDPSRKEDIFFGVATLIGCGAYALLTFAPAFMVLAQPYFIILAGTFSFVYLGKVFHKEDKAKPESG